MTPGRLAVVSGGRTLTYGQLEATSRFLASRLQDRGLRAGEPVAVLLHRSVDWPAAILGVLRAGGSYLPIDPSYPRGRIDFMLEDSQARFGLTSTELEAAADFPGRRFLQVDDEVIAPARVESPADVMADQPAYLIYTSGSTGKPKGVLISHGNLLASTVARFEYYRSPIRSYLLLSSPAFDSSVAGIFWTLCGGGTLVVPEEGEKSDPGRLLRLVDRHRISHLMGLPSLYRRLLDRDKEGVISGLKTAIVAGERCHPDTVRQHFERYPHVELFNEYGPTETSVWATVFDCRQEAPPDDVPIGRAAPHIETLVLDENDRPAEIGEPGQLFLGGQGVGLGYLNRPDLTSERFRVHEGRGRVYRTGDRVRQLPSGDLAFLGRTDDQVKIRGYRVEPGEVESALLAHPAVLEAAVVNRPDRSGASRLCAYVVVVGGSEAIETELHRFVARKLPDYMVPSSVWELQELPRTPNGKVDRQKLTELRRGRPVLTQSFAPADTAVERWLALCWADLLQIERVGVKDRFFELGGDSLKAADFVNELSAELEEPVFVTTLFEAPTIASYAGLLQNQYPEAIARRFGPSHRPADRTATSRSRGIDAAAVDRMQRSIPALPPNRDRIRSDPPNEPALFILAPPRSGTTLLRVMLSGHPGLFAVSELNLLGFRTMGERRSALSGRFSAWKDGLTQALMALRGSTPAEAIAMVEGWETEDLPTRQLYASLQESIGRRMLVEKTPAYAFDPRTLAEAERSFDRPLYIHLHRHPYATVRSFEERRLNQVLFLHQHPFDARQLGELLWIISHRNITSFLRQVPRRRRVRLAFEDLVTQPRRSLERVCDRLGIEWHPALLRPYDDLDRKMPKGVYPQSTPMDDVCFVEHGRIRPEIARRSDDVCRDDFLGEVTWELANRLGYARPSAAAALKLARRPPKRSRGSDRRRRRDRRRNARTAGEKR